MLRYTQGSHPDAPLPFETVAVFGRSEACRGRIEEDRALGVALPAIAPVPVELDVYAAWAAVVQMFRG